MTKLTKNAPAARRRTRNGHLVVWFSAPANRLPLAPVAAGFPRRRALHSAFQPSARGRKHRGRSGPMWCSRPRARSAKSLRLITPRAHEPYSLDDYGSNLSPADARSLCADVDDLFWLDHYGTNFDSEPAGSYSPRSPVDSGDLLSANA